MHLFSSSCVTAAEQYDQDFIPHRLCNWERPADNKVGHFLTQSPPPAALSGCVAPTTFYAAEDQGCRSPAAHHEVTFLQDRVHCQRQGLSGDQQSAQARQQLQSPAEGDSPELGPISLVLLAQLAACLGCRYTKAALHSGQSATPVSTLVPQQPWYASHQWLSLSSLTDDRLHCMQGYKGIPTSYLMGSTVGINAVDIPGCKERHYT